MGSSLRALNLYGRLLSDAQQETTLAMYLHDDVRQEQVRCRPKGNEYFSYYGLLAQTVLPSVKNARPIRHRLGRPQRRYE